jgi:hypothetical protein
MNKTGRLFFCLNILNDLNFCFGRFELPLWMESKLKWLDVKVTAAYQNWTSTLGNRFHPIYAVNV